MLLSIVIPVYKSSVTLIELAKRIDRVVWDRSDTDYEIIFVNDSPFWDKTSTILKGLAEENSKVITIELMKNFGQQPATLCGIEHAIGDFIVTMDDDLQHAPEDIPKLLEECSHDVVIARFHSKKHSLFKRALSSLKGYFDQIILGKPSSIVLSPFRLIQTPVAKLMLNRNTPYPFIPALLFEITHDVVNVDVDHHPRAEGSGNYTFTKMFGVFSNLIINNSSLMLRLLGYVGSTIALIAFTLAISIIVRKLAFDIAIIGWASVFTAILFFGGMTLLTLGIVGEYLVRIIATTEKRPTFYVREIFSVRDGHKPS
jgi:glycosyltransferase involved in cell wall biosynthesis